MHSEWRGLPVASPTTVHRPNSEATMGEVYKQ